MLGFLAAAIVIDTEFISAPSSNPRFVVQRSLIGITVIPVIPGKEESSSLTLSHGPKADSLSTHDGCVDCCGQYPALYSDDR